MTKILIIDPERSIRNSLKSILEHEGYQITTAQDSHEAIQQGSNGEFDCILCDSAYICEENLMATLHKSSPSTPILVTTKETDLNIIKEWIEQGANAVLQKQPFDLNKLLHHIKTSIDKTLAKEYNQICDEDCKVISRKKKTRVEPMIGESIEICRVKRMIDKVAPIESKVLIMGDNGTGKELVARWLHEKSSRRNAPFIEVNCAAIPSELIESELFGHEKGAFTSAIKQRKGKFEQADGGTLFLDEIGDMSLSAQAKVLRALQESVISRVGSDRDIEVNVRVIAATNKNLKEEIALRNFREDLYHRLSVIIIKVPSLNERVGDIPLLVDYFITGICADKGMFKKEISQEAMDELRSINWSGNIRQLHNVIERLIILSENSITLDDVKENAFL